MILKRKAFCLTNLFRSTLSPPPKKIQMIWSPTQGPVIFPTQVPGADSPDLAQDALLDAETVRGPGVRLVLRDRLHHSVRHPHLRGEFSTKLGQ